MTSKPRRSGGQSKPATEKAEAEQTEPAAPAAAEETPASDNTSEDGEQAGDKVIPGVAGDPVPAEVDKGLVLEETGLSPEPFTGVAPSAASEADPERNGAPDSPVDRSGELRKQPAVPTAPYGGSEANGKPIRAEAQVDRSFGNNGDPQAKLAGVTRADIGNGTANPDLPEDERPTYPSTTLTRSSSSATPMEPEDVKYVTQPKLGVVEASTDPIAAAAVISSLPGDVLVKLVNQDGEEVKPSEFFEVPDGPAARSLRVVKHRVSEVFTTRAVKSPGKRLLYIEGQQVPVAQAETLIALHG